jgi:hypothetical protein
MDLMIWLGLIFKLRHWEIHSVYLRAFKYLFGIIWGAQMPQNSLKNFFLAVLDYFFYKNGSNDLVRGLFSSLDIGTYILSICGPLYTFLGPFGGSPNSPEQHIKNYFLVVLDYFFYKNGPDDLVRGLFSS